MPTPAIVDGILVNHDGAGWVAGDFITNGVGKNAVWRLHADGGSIIWQTPFSRGASGIGDCPPVSDGSRVYCDYISPVWPDTVTVIGDQTVERVYALRVADGALIWDVALETGALPERNEAAIPLLAGGLLYLGAIAPYVHALDSGSGLLVWEISTPGAVTGGIVAVDGIIYFGDLGGYLSAVDAKTGRVLGDKFMHAHFNVGSPVVDGKTLIIGSDEGSVIAVPLDAIRSSHDS